MAAKVRVELIELDDTRGTSNIVREYVASYIANVSTTESFSMVLPDHNGYSGYYARITALVGNVIVHVSPDTVEIDQHGGVLVLKDTSIIQKVFGKNNLLVHEADSNAPVSIIILSNNVTNTDAEVNDVIGSVLLKYPPLGTSTITWSLSGDDAALFDFDGASLIVNDTLTAGDKNITISAQPKDSEGTNVGSAITLDVVIEVEAGE